MSSISDKTNDMTSTKHTIASSKIAAIITCFNPNPVELEDLIGSIKTQVQLIILVNNGGLNSDLSNKFQNLSSNTELITLNPATNLGTAGGYNLGAEKAWSQGMTHLLLLDQDSLCKEDMVSELIQLENFLTNSNLKVAAVGPYYICKSNNQPAPFIQHVNYQIDRVYENSEQVISFNNGNKYVPCSYIISSGSLISKESWNQIGTMNEGLFLDFTDIEWGLRASSKGFQCFGSFDAKMYHLIGDEQLSLLGRKISLHSPLRHYYAFRNCVWLFTQGNIPLGTRVNYLIKLLPKILIYSAFSKTPSRQLRFMLLGILDGIFHKMGIYSR